MVVLAIYELMHHHDILFREPGPLPFHDASESIISQDMVLFRYGHA